MASAATPLRVMVIERRHELVDIARRHGGHNLRLFGSVARGDDRPDSDVDLLLDLERGRTLLDLVAIRQEASDLLGVQVDVEVDQILPAVSA
jgi:predicted nucleotidyltransferase